MDRIESDNNIPSKILSKTELRNLATVARKVLDLFDLMTKTFNVLQILIQTISFILNRAF